MIIINIPILYLFSPAQYSRRDFITNFPNAQNFFIDPSPLYEKKGPISKPPLHLPQIALALCILAHLSLSLSTHAAPATRRHLRLVQPPSVRTIAHLAFGPHLSDPSLSRTPSSPSLPSAEKPRSPSLSFPPSPCAKHHPPCTTLVECCTYLTSAPLSSLSASLSHTHGLPRQRILSVPLSQPDSHSQLFKTSYELSKFTTIALVDIDSQEIQVYVKYFDISLIPSTIFFFNAHHMKMDSRLNED